MFICFRKIIFTLGELLKKHHIHLLQIGEFKLDFFEDLKNHLIRVFPGVWCTSSIYDRSFLEGSYNPARKQYYSTLLLKKIEGISSEVRADRFLAVVDVDLYVPRLNFVFGEAQCPGRFAIISIFRLKPEFYGLDKNQELFISRVKKEAVHELGHTLGLLHCENPLCVMYFSNSIYDTDNKRDDFCLKCKDKVLKALNHDLYV